MLMEPGELKMDQSLLFPLEIESAIIFASFGACEREAATEYPDAGCTILQAAPKAMFRWGDTGRGPASN